MNVCMNACMHVYIRVHQFSSFGAKRSHSLLLLAKLGELLQNDSAFQVAGQLDAGLSL